jgi:uncharacterized repeat protein (TIGR02543 family)
MLLYSKAFSKGKITLGGNLQSPAAGAQNNYVIIILPKVSPVQYSLSTTINGNGSITKSPNQTAYSNGTMVSLTAIPAAGQQFTGWSSDASGTTNPLTVTMNSNKTITANFVAIQYSLTVSSSGSGSVAKSPDQLSYNSGTNVTLTATPVSGQKFTGWSGDASGTTNPLTITMNSNKTITANFAAIQYSLTTSSSGSGSVSKSPDQALYNSGTKVILTATQGSGQQFTGWSRYASGTTNPLTVTMNSNKTITANFSAVPLSVSNIIATTGSSYTLGELTVGVTVYTDRTIQATSVPASLNKAPFIKTPDEDRSNKSDTLLSFNINQDATIFIAYDPGLKIYQHG